MESEPAYAREAIQSGVLGYVLKEAVDEELVTAVHLAAAGRTYLQPELGARLAIPAVAQHDPESVSPCAQVRSDVVGHIGRAAIVTVVPGSRW